MPELIKRGPLSKGLESRVVSGGAVQFRIPGQGQIISQLEALRIIEKAYQIGYIKIADILQHKLPDYVKKALETMEQVHVMQRERRETLYGRRLGQLDTNLEKRIKKAEEQEAREEAEKSAREREQAHTQRLARLMGIQNIMGPLFGGGGGIGGALGAGVQAGMGAEAAATSMGMGAGGAGAIGGIVGVITAIKDLVLKFAGLQKLIDFVNGIKDLILNPAFQILSDILSGLGGIINTILIPLKPFFKMLEVIGKLLEAAMAPLIVEIWDDLAPMFEDMFDNLGDLEGLFDDLLPSIRAAMLVLPDVLTRVIPQIINQLPTILGYLSTFISESFVTLLEALPTLLQLAGDIVNKIVNNIDELIVFATAIGLIVDAIITLASWFIEAVGWWFDTFANEDYWNQVGTNISRGVVFQSGGFVTSPTVALVGEKESEFIFTKEQTAALAGMGIYGGNRDIVDALEKNNKLQMKLIKIQQRLQEEMEFMI